MLQKLWRIPSAAPVWLLLPGSSVASTIPDLVVIQRGVQLRPLRQRILGQQHSRVAPAVVIGNAVDVFMAL